MPLTEKELSALEQQLRREQLLVQKYKVYASVCSDHQLKLRCEQIAAQHQGHYTALLNQLN